MDTPLPDEKGMLLETYGNDEFSRDVIHRVAELRTELEENAGLLHVQMQTLSTAVRSAISSGSTELPLRICAFLDEALGQPRAIPEIENAVAISFVTASELQGSSVGAVILERMPTRVRQLLLDHETRKNTQS